MRQYVWQSVTWPEFHWDNDRLIQPLAQCRLIQGKLLNQLASLDFELGQQAYAEILVEEAMQTSFIEGERLNLASVRSSVARRLGFDTVGLPPSDRYVDGLVDVLLDATERYDALLTAERLKRWQTALFPTGYSGLHRIITGDWRGKKPMQIVSGPIGRERIHYEAPPAKHLEAEMAQFLTWWQQSLQQLDGVLRAGIAHFWFVTIHPFEDGNGRIARAITDMALAQDEEERRRFYSLSAQIVNERDMYYDILERTQQGNGEITEWLMWFLGCFQRAVGSAHILHQVLAKATFWKRHAQTLLNNRQRKVINRLLDARQGGFEGGLSTKKYASMTKVSRATAYREISDLVKKQVLQSNQSGGRSTSYDLIWSE